MKRVVKLQSLQRQFVNNPDYLVGTTTMTELFECGGVTAYQEGGEVFVTPSSLLNAGSGDYVAGSNTMSNMFAKGGELDWLDNQEEVEVKIGSKTILFDVVEFNDVYVFDPATKQDEDKADGLMERNENAVVDGLSRFLRKNVKGVAFLMMKIMEVVDLPLRLMKNLPRAVS